MDRLKPLFFAISIFLPPCVSSAAIEEPKKNIGVSEVKYINTVLEIAKPTALAPIRVKNGVKLMALATNNGGEVVIQNAVIGFDHGSSFQPAPGAARDADATAADIALSAVAGTVAANYQTCHENAEQLRALQTWGRKMASATK